jgi:GTPase SAR1 family protein
MTKSTVVVDVITKSGKKSNGTYARLNNSNKNVTVVVMGDEGVGKTSLISTYISRHFVEEGLPGCMTRFTLPPDTTTYMPYLVLGGEEEEEKGAASQKGFVCSLVDTQGAAPTLLPKRGNTADMCSSDICDANATTKNNSSSSSSSLTSPNSSLSSPTAATNTIADDASVSVTQSIRNSIPTAQTKIQRDTTDVNVIVLVYDLVRSESFTRLEQHWLPLIETCFDGEVSNNVSPAYVGIPNCPLISLSAEITYSNWGQISVCGRV